MAEEKKKPGTVKRIFKWIGLGLATLLLIAAIIFQAPWKVTTLLIIILLACTVLPKPARKWFWLSAGAVVIALIIWVFLPERKGDWRPYTFDEELAALEAKYAIPESENAATIYNKLLQDYDKDAFYTNLPDNELDKLPMREPWLSRDHPKIAECLQEQQGKIAKLVEAAKIEKCRFPIVADSAALGRHMEILAPMRRWAFLLVTAANNDIAEGRIKEGLQKNIVLLQMGKHLCQQHSTIDWLVGIAIEAIARSQFKTFVVTEDANEEYLSFIEKALISINHNWSYDFPRILEDDKLSAKREFARYYEINPKGKIRLSRDPWAKMRAKWKKRLENNETKESQMREIFESFVYPTYWKRKLIKAQTILLWFYLPSSPQKLDEILDTIFQDYYEMAKPDFDWDKKPQELPTSRFKFRINRYRTLELLAGVSEKSYYQIHKIHLRLSTDIRAGQLIIALRRYKNKTGHWPESLDEVKSFADPNVFIDPINGDSFVYKLTDENFTLYSKGKNNIDDNGKRDKWDEQTGADDWLIWPRRSRKTQKKNTDDEQQ